MGRETPATARLLILKIVKEGSRMTGYSTPFALFIKGDARVRPLNVGSTAAPSFQNCADILN
jgi:hypothetical protein